MSLFNDTYYAYNKALPKKICEEIIKDGETKEFKSSNIFGDLSKKRKRKVKSISSLKIRNSKNSWLHPFWIYKEIKPFIEYSNKLSKWNLDYNIIEEFQFTKYEGNKKQHYSWHSDEDTEKEIGQPVRKLSTIIMLSDPKDFEGGDLEFYNYSPPKKKKQNIKNTSFKTTRNYYNIPFFCNTQSFTCNQRFKIQFSCLAQRTTI